MPLLQITLPNFYTSVVLRVTWRQGHAESVVNLVREGSHASSGYDTVSVAVTGTGTGTHHVPVWLPSIAEYSGTDYNNKLFHDIAPLVCTTTATTYYYNYKITLRIQLLLLFWHRRQRLLF